MTIINERPNVWDDTSGTHNEVATYNFSICEFDKHWPAIWKEQKDMCYSKRFKRSQSTLIINSIDGPQCGGIIDRIGGRPMTIGSADFHELFLCFDT